MSIKDNLHDRLHPTQWGANLVGWWHERILNHRSHKDLIAGNIMNTTTQISEGLSESMGIDLKGLLNGVLGAKLVSNND